MKMIIANEVEKVFFDCQYREEELTNGKVPDNAIVVDGIIHKFGFNPNRVKTNKEEIKHFMNELPETFKEGWSFLNICFDKNGNQWGDDRIGEQLVVLGLAAGYMEYPAPKEMWPMLPGSVPYIIVNTN
ncbi:hypothetical protein MZM54_00220 [[Brevibacterium] frigoritolerans]|nr:hypothetical protein [Peribacillus frigoritolerans]